MQDARECEKALPDLIRFYKLIGACSFFLFTLAWVSAWISSDTLISLRVGDPQNATCERWLPADVYDKAFDAWEAARESVYTTWKAHRPERLPARPAAVVPWRVRSRLPRRGLPRPRHPDCPANRLRSVPTAKVSRQVRGPLNQGRTDEERIGLVIEVLDEAGITAPPPREPLADIEEHEVRLVTWLAVKGTRGVEGSVQ